MPPEELDNTTAGDAGSVTNVDDFSDLASLDLDLADDFSPEVTATAGEEEVQPVVTGEDEPDAPTDQQQQQQQQQQEVEEPIVKDETETTPPVELTPEQHAEKMRVDRENALKEITSHFEASMTDEEREALLTEPARVIPTLLARAQVQAFESAVSAVFGQLPVMLERFLANREASANAEQQFFQQYGEDLRPHTQDIQAAITLLRQKNPKATREQIASGAAQMVRAMHNMQAAPVPQRQTQRPVAPAGTAVSRAPVTSPQSQKPADDNPFAMLAGIEDF